MCDPETKQFIKETVENNTNRIKYDILRAFEPLKKDVEQIEGKLTEVVETVGGHSGKIRDLEEVNRSRELNCPYAPAIKELMENLLTNAALQEYMREQESRQLKIQKAKDTKMRWIVGLIGIGFTIITIIVNVVIFHLSKGGG